MRKILWRFTGVFGWKKMNVEFVKALSYVYIIYLSNIDLYLQTNMHFEKINKINIIKKK